MCHSLASAFQVAGVTCLSPQSLMLLLQDFQASLALQVALS